MKSIYRTFFSILTALLILLPSTSCSDTLWDDLPESVSNFITRYFPGQAIESENWNDDDSLYTVKLKGSDMLTFNKNLSWTSINGRGGTVPQMFLFDELPPALYEYLQSMEAVDGVYQVSRSDSYITIELHDSTVMYDISNGAITMPQINGWQTARLLINTPETQARLI